MSISLIALWVSIGSLVVTTLNVLWQWWQIIKERKARPKGPRAIPWGLQR